MPNPSAIALRNQFQLLDTDRDGLVAKADFNAVAARLAQACGADQHTARRLHDRHAALWDLLYPHPELAVEQFLQPRPPALAALQPFAEDVVGVCDSDADGELGPGDFRTLMSAWHLPGDDADHVFRRLDVDFTGSVSATELAEAFEELYTALDPHLPGLWLFGPIDHGPTARLPYPDPATLPPDVRRLLEALPPLNIFRMTANAPSVFAAAINLSRAVIGELELPGRLRELAILKVAGDLDATYVWTQHVSAARAERTPRAKLLAVRDGRLDAPCLSQDEQAVLAFTAEIMRGGHVSDTTFARLRTHLSPRQIVELIIATGTYTIVGRLTTALTLEPDTPQGDAVVRYASATSHREET